MDRKAQTEDPWKPTKTYVSPVWAKCLDTKKFRLMRMSRSRHILYHFDWLFTGCDTWCSWTLPDRVHKQILAVTGTKSVRFAPKYYLNRQVSCKLPNYTKIDLIKCSQQPVTHDETPQVLGSQLLVTHDWTVGWNGTVVELRGKNVRIPTYTFQKMPKKSKNTL